MGSLAATTETSSRDCLLTTCVAASEHVVLNFNAKKRDIVGVLRRLRYIRRYANDILTVQCIIDSISTYASQR